MNARPALPEEYLALTRLAPDPKAFRRELARLVDIGYTAPRLWFASGPAGAPDAAAFYWALPSLPDEMMLYDLHADFRIPGAEGRLAGVLAGSVGLLAARGARSFEARLFSDSTERIYEKIAILRAAGFPLLQEKESFAVTAPPSASPGNLRYAPLSGCGHAAFRDAIERINARTLDRYDIESSSRAGNPRHAEEMFLALSDIERDESRWTLAFDEEGLAGLAVPQMVDEETGVMNYFGVVPEKRRRGYGYELFAHGADLLFRAGARRVVCDLDLANRPMIAIMERAGAARSFRVWVFKAQAASLAAAAAYPG